MQWDVLPHAQYLPQYTTFVRSTSSPFVVGSTYILNRYLQSSSDIQFELFPQDDADGIRITTRNFRSIRNNFISKISNSTLRREQTFANLMSAADIGRLDPTRSLHDVEDFDQCSSAYHHPLAESGQHASIGVTYSGNLFYVEEFGVWDASTPIISQKRHYQMDHRPAPWSAQFILRKLFWISCDGYFGRYFGQEVRIYQ